MKAVTSPRQRQDAAPCQEFADRTVGNTSRRFSRREGMVNAGPGAKHDQCSTQIRAEEVRPAQTTQLRMNDRQVPGLQATTGMPTSYRAWLTSHSSERPLQLKSAPW